MTEVKLNLGAGTTEIEGYTPVDISNGHPAYPLTDYADGSVDEIRASHILEHFSFRDTANVLKDWHRALKPGGWLKVAVPDLDKILRTYEEAPDPLFEPYLLGGHTDEHDVHLAVFNETKIRELFQVVGFADVRFWKSEIEDCAALPVSLNLMGRKCATVAAPALKVSAAMSVPRLGFMDNFFCAFEALMPLKIPFRRVTGAFWGQCLERCMEQIIEEQHPDAILTMDYDSLFSPRDLAELIRLMATHSEADAITTLQAARWRKSPLLTIQDENGNATAAVNRASFDPDLCRVATAHFGLTLIRTSALADVPHPWFKAVPAPDGTWGDGRLDDDCWFWKQWAEHGKTLYLANRIAIGHAELMVSWPDVNMETIHQTIADYREKGKPEEAWK